MKNLIQKNKRLVMIVFLVILLLCIPWMAMQFTNEVNWNQFDFMVASVLLFSTGLGCELILRNTPKTIYRAVFCGLLFLALCLIWIELAVGVFGTPFAGS